MKRGVEDGDLRNVRQRHRDGVDALEVRWVVQRRQRAALIDRGDDVGGDHNAFAEAIAAVHDAMADGNNDQSRGLQLHKHGLHRGVVIDGAEGR